MSLGDELAAMKRPHSERLSVSVPADLAKWVRTVAKANGVTVSAVVELALRRSQQR